MAAYYNEIDAFAAQWLRNLIAAGHIAPGEVDERSIVEVEPDDLRGFDQCHFFAGIGGWSYALRLAGWPDDRPVWTGSCPCQPFSAAGYQRGSDDERHLWPSWFRLIRERLPSTIFGEQVAGSAGLAWLDHVLADVEGEGYAAAAADLPACGVGAPHIRQRIFWMADRCEVGCSSETPIKELDGQRLGVNGVACAWRNCEWLQCADGSTRPIEPGVHAVADGIPPGMGRVCGYGNAIVPQVAAEFIAAYMECRP